MSANFLKIFFVLLYHTDDICYLGNDNIKKVVIII